MLGNTSLKVNPFFINKKETDNMYVCVFSFLKYKANGFG